MLVVVRRPRTRRPVFEVRGRIPRWLVRELRDKYRETVTMSRNDDNSLINITSTDWYKDINGRMKPGDYVRIYRENAGLSQEELGVKVGAFNRQNISAIERGERGISKAVAIKFSGIFKVPIDRFIA